MKKSDLNCIGCGTSVPDIGYPTHKYLGAGPGCWNIYREVLAREYSDYRYLQIHLLTVDAYAAQHPGKSSGKTIRSLNVHLVSMYMILEQILAMEKAADSTRKLLELRDKFTWHEPPESLGEVTVKDVVNAGDLNDHISKVRMWARSVWAAWTPHHTSIEKLARQAGLASK